MKNKNFIAFIALVAISINLMPVHAALQAVSSTNDPVNGYPVWYQDSQGLAIEQCFEPNNLKCLADPVIPGNVFSEETGFGGEAFWWTTEALMNIKTPIPGGGSSGRALMVLALEAAYANEDPAPGEQMSFGRVRFFIDAPVAGEYKITYPFGTITEDITVPGIRAIKISDDVGCFPVPAAGITCDYSLALRSNVGPFLRWDTDYPVVDSNGVKYVGDPAIEHTITGSLNGNNIFRIEGPLGSNLGGPGIDTIETNLFSVSGKLYSGPVVTGVSSTDGAYKAGSTINILVTFNQPVVVTGIPSITLETGTIKRQATFVSGSRTNTLTFAYVVQAGDTSSKLDYTGTNSLALNGGTINDATLTTVPAILNLFTSGTSGSLSANNNIVIDTTAPVLGNVSSTNSDGVYKAGSSIPLTVSFSEPIFVTGTPSIILETGTVKENANFASGSGTNSLTFAYTVQAGDTSSKLDYTGTNAFAMNGGTITDAAGNDAVITLALPGSIGSLGANKNIIIDTTVPSVSGISSTNANGMYKIGDNIALTATFSETVVVSGTPNITLETGAVKENAVYSSGNGTNSLTFSYTVQSGDTTGKLDYTGTNALSLNSGTITDAAGNDAVLSLSLPGSAGSLGSSKNLVIDGIAPTFVNSSSTDGTVTNTLGTIIFEMNDNNGVDQTGTIITATKDGSGFTGFTRNNIGVNQVTATITSPTDGLYKFSVTPKDTAGNFAGSSITINVTYDTTAPTVAGVTSSNNDGVYKAGSSINITVSFSETVVVIGTPTIKLETGTIEEKAIYSGGSGTNSLTFVYTVQSGDDSRKLDYTADDTFSLNHGTIRDLAGNDALITLPVPGTNGSLSTSKSIEIDTDSPVSGNVSSMNDDKAYKANDTINITLVFSETVVVIGTPSITLDTGDVKEHANYVSGSGTNNLTFAYIVQSGDKSNKLEYEANDTFSLNNGTIRDLAGNDALITLPVPGTNGSLGMSKNIVIDTDIPVITLVSASPNQNSATITWTTDEDSTSKVFYGTTTNTTLNITDDSRRASHSIGVNDLSDSTQYYFSVFSCDAAGNCNMSAQSVFATLEPPRPAVSSGGGGGSSSSGGGNSGGSYSGGSSSFTNPTGPSAIYVYSRVIPEEPFVSRIADISIKMKEVEIEVNDQARDVKVTVAKLDDKPVTVTQASGSVFQYLEIKTSLEKDNIKSAKLRFEVTKEWLAQNNLGASEIKLLRFADNGWQKLPTKMSAELSDFYQFEAVSPGFSTFAIIGEKETQANPETGTNIESTDTTIPLANNSTTTETAGTNATESNTTATPENPASETENQQPNVITGQVTASGNALAIAGGIALILISALLVKKFVISPQRNGRSRTNGSKIRSRNDGNQKKRGV